MECRKATSFAVRAPSPLAALRARAQTHQGAIKTCSSARRHAPAAAAAPPPQTPLRRGRPSAAVHAANPLGVLANAEVIYEATGVPLVDQLMALSSVGAAAHHSVHLLALIAAAAVWGR